MTRHHGFTLIELLMVMAIIAIIAGIVIIGAGQFKRSSLRARTQAILQTVALGLGEGDATTGGSTAPAEHPLAGSAAPRDFPRVDANTPRARFRRGADGTLVGVTDEALVVDDRTWLTTGADRVLLPDDRFDGQVVSGDLPLLFGMRRDRIGVLGATSDWITAYRRLPPLGRGFDAADGRHLLAPYTDLNYPDGRFLVASALPPRTLLDDANASAIRQSLGSQFDKLSSLGGALLDSAPPSDVADDAAWIAGRRDVTRPASGAWDPAQRVWLVDQQPGKPPVSSPVWLPGMLKVGKEWRRYRFRGLGVYDSWGREILYTLSGGGVRLVSAGEDGVFRWHPGPDGIYQSAATGDLAAGDDRDGAIDNIRVGAP